MEWFLMRESAPKINSTAKKALFKAFDSSKSKDKIKTDLIKNTETVFLFKQNFGKNKINFFHHLSVLGGIFFETQEHYGAIQGIDEDVTSIVTPDISQFLEILSVANAVPDLDEYMRITSVNKHSTLKVYIGNYFTPRNFIPVPPFMLNELNKTILETDGNSVEALMTAISVIKEFDNHVDEQDDTSIENAKDTCIDILHWLYLALRGRIDSTPTVACSVRSVPKHFSSLEKMEGLNKNALEIPSNNKFDTSSIQKPLEIIAASSSLTQDFLSKLTQIQTTSQEKTTNSFTKLSEKVQHMILIAASRGSVIPQKLNDEATAFFKLTNFSRAQQYLESYLESKGIDCAVPTAVENLWLQGCFLWMNPLTPSGLATSVIASKDVMFNYSLQVRI